MSLCAHSATASASVVLVLVCTVVTTRHTGTAVPALRCGSRLAFASSLRSQSFSRSMASTAVGIGIAAPCRSAGSRGRFVNAKPLPQLLTGSAVPKPRAADTLHLVQQSRTSALPTTGARRLRGPHEVGRWRAERESTGRPGSQQRDIARLLSGRESRRARQVTEPVHTVSVYHRWRSIPASIPHESITALPRPNTRGHTRVQKSTD